MFIQVIQGRVRDEPALRRGMDRWHAELLPGAVGYLGTTAGICDDGRFIALARFDSAADARANSDRPEQGAWWSETAKALEDDVTFLDCDGARSWLDGGSDDAGFVQVMVGRSPDVARLHEIMMGHAQQVRAGRPDIIGALLMDLGDGRYVEAAYFTSEQAARAGETQEVPADMRAEMDEMRRLMGEVSYFDLRAPILVSP